MASDLAVIASRRFQCATIVLLSILCALALDVPQVPDQRILSDYPPSVGPFITTLALNTLGHSVPLWVLLLFLLVAAFRPGLGLKWALPGLVPMVLLFVFGGNTDGPEAPGRTTLLVSIPQADGTTSDFLVSEGRPFILQGKTFVFGVTDTGPYAVERDESGHLRAYIQADRPLTGQYIEVASRRPSVRPKPLLPAWANHLLSILIACTALWVLLEHTVQTPQVTSALLFSGAFLAASPFAGPGMARFILSSGSGAVHHLMEVAGPEDIGSYLAMVPAATTLWLPHTLTLVGCAAGCVGLLVLMLAPTSRFQRLPVMTAAVSWASAAVLVALGAIFRFPLGITQHDLDAVFERDILPRLPMELSVLAHRADPSGPYTIPLIGGLATAVSVAAPAIALFLRPASRPKENPGLLAPVVLASLLVLRALLCTTALPEGAPAAVVPVSLVAAIVVTVFTFSNPELRTIAAGMALLTVG